MTTIKGSHAIITGGSEGIGLASARHLLSRGAATVSLIARRRDRLDHAARELGNDRVRTEAADVTDRDVLDAAIERLVAAAGPCDVLITSAGYAHPGRFTELDIDVFREQMEVNYFGTLHAIRAVVMSMVERRAGHIVVVSSDVGLMGVYGYSAYAPTKFAVRGLAETLRGELKPHGIRVGIAYPPDTETPGFERENLIKPAETTAISASIKPRSADVVGRAIVDAIAKDKLTITADVQSAVLARTIGIVAPVVRASMDATVRKVQRALRQ